VRGAIAVVVLGLLSARVARAQDAGVDGAGDASVEAPATTDLSSGPRALSTIQPAYTPEAQRAGVAGEVVLVLTIDDRGDVTDVAVETGLPAGLTEAAVEAARAAKFLPARDARGVPMAIRVRWTVRFTLPEVRKAIAPEVVAPDGGAPETEPPPPPLPPNVEKFATGDNGVLAIQIREKGTGKTLSGATVWIEDVGELVHADAQGRLERALAPGAYALAVRVPGHQQDERVERVRAGERLERVYFVLKERLNEYETIIKALPPRAETGVVSLQAEEIHGVAGTMGDPFRVAMLLPGVASVFSGVGYPIIRGEAPGQTGTFIDDVKIPLLYHLGFGPAVVHPLYLDALDFHPGNFPAEFGRFTGGLIRAKTTPAPEERTTMLELDLFKGSAFHAQPFKLLGHDAAISAAARYGTFAFLARAIDPHAVLSYWDFQTRADLKTGGGAWRLLVFGASDAVGTAGYTDDFGNVFHEDILRTGFVRGDLRYRLFRRGRLGAELGVEVGPDFTTNSNQSNPAHLVEWVARPRAALDFAAAEKLKLRAGVDTLYQTWNANLQGHDFSNLFFPRFGLTYGAFAQAEWQPTPAWLIAPGVRGDLFDYHFGETFSADRSYATSVDPRLSVRRRLRADLYLKGAVGRYHSPPRFLLPWPGLEGFGLRESGLNDSIQSTVGVEAKLPFDLSLDAQVYFNWLRRVSEYSLNDVGGGSSQGMDMNLTDTLVARHGRAYGLELIARRRLGNRLFGWLAYSLSRSERDYGGISGWRPTDFDETHLVNAVVSYALGRSWTVAGTFHYNTGRPVTPQPIITFRPGEGDPGAPPPLPPEVARNSDRLPSFWRVDARIEKREAFDTWYLDFYVDWLNISLQREITDYSWIETMDQTGQVVVKKHGNGPLLTIPTMGLRAEF
jgi:TonB family protein